MKKLLLLILIPCYTFSQASVEIRLVDPNVGTPNFSWPPGSGNTSNDGGLNAIFSAYNVSNYANNYAHPYPPYVQKMKIIFGTFPSQFLTDLLAYSNVIASAKISNENEFTDALRLQLIDLNIGSPTTINTSIVVTNDSGLNTIFENFNVFYYAQSYPSSSSNQILRYYDVVCDCDKNLLKTTLLNYNSVIETTETINGGLILANPNITNALATIYPNPFTYNFNIQTEQTITNYSIIDITGKTILNTSSKVNLDNQSSQLSAGMYILELNFDNGQKVNYKLVKK